MEYYSAIKKNSFESVLMRWMKLEPIIQSEVSQKDKDHYNIFVHIFTNMGFSGGSGSRESTCNAGDLDSIPELGRSPGGGHGNPLQYSCLENSMARGAW